MCCSLEQEFRVEDKLGDGGYGVVLLVKRHLSDHLKLALKLKINTYG